MAGLVDDAKAALAAEYRREVIENLTRWAVVIVALWVYKKS